ncbi:cytochrome P450 [Artomyces pyxidatus]|uniref:Cytochrome P450 n=1 Tax=Artomyces pyxidatus TaxID=48021 RepID=A0ACB8SL20_9AGAM|nr:cytochrome P450 [Artomyces pyxidatus]
MFLEFPEYPLLRTILLTTLVTTSLGIAAVVIALGRRAMKHRVLLHIPGPASPSFWAGNALEMFDAVTGFKYRDQVRKTFGTLSRFHGPFGDQILLISDPAALTAVLGKDRDIFEEAYWFIELFRHAVGPGLLCSTGAHHRKQRKLLNPSFSVSRLKAMVPLLHKITNELIDSFNEKIPDGRGEVEVLDPFGRVALEMIAQTGLGYTFESFKPEANKNEFTNSIKEFMSVVGKLQVFLPLFPLVSHWNAKFLRFIAACIPSADLHYIIKLSDITKGGLQRLFQAKKEMLARGDAAELMNQISEGKDIINTLMRENAESADEYKIEDDEIKAQMHALVAAATDTTSVSLARLAQVLAQHPEWQEKLRQELNEAVASRGEELGYDELFELPYLEAVTRETWRLYAPVTFVTRCARSDTTLPLLRPIQGVNPPQTSIFVPEGTNIIIDILGGNCEQSMWGPDADEWKPERWLAPLPDSVTDAHIPGVYSNLFTFLSGSRSCIGFKQAELEIKVVLSQILRNFRFSEAKTEVVWRLGPVITPSVNTPAGIKFGLPLVMERLQ